MQKRPKRKKPARIKVIFSFIFFSVSDACEPRPSKATRHRDLRLISKTLIGNLCIALRLTRARRALTISFPYLRLSRLDDAVADYDEALRRKPKQAGSLYGRGLAKLKKGDAAGSEADIAGAKAIQADVAEKFARYGVTPSAATAR
jgi:hypothetical protein